MFRIIKNVSTGNFLRRRFSDYRIPNEEFWSTKLSSYENWKETLFYVPIPDETIKKIENKNMYKVS